jgi:hypothetical protein
VRHCGPAGVAHHGDGHGPDAIGPDLLAALVTGADALHPSERVAASNHCCRILTSDGDSVKLKRVALAALIASIGGATAIGPLGVAFHRRRNGAQV